jgi:hypothetical protein
MSKWETEDHFVSWLRLCPDNRIIGDRKGRLPTNTKHYVLGNEVPGQVGCSTYVFHLLAAIGGRNT